MHAATGVRLLRPLAGRLVSPAGGYHILPWDSMACQEAENHFRRVQTHLPPDPHPTQWAPSHILRAFPFRLLALRPPS